MGEYPQSDLGELHPRTDTQDESTGPPEALTQAAVRLIPPTLADMAKASDNPGPDPAPGLKVVRYSQIVQTLRGTIRRGRGSLAMIRLANCSAD